MPGRFRGAAKDLVKLRDVDVYVAATVAVVLAALTVIPLLPEPANWGDQARWAVTLAALAILVFRSASPPSKAETFAEIVGDRSTFDRRSLAERWGSAREVCIFAPSAVNLLSAQNCETLARTVLSRRDGKVRIVVIDPTTARSAARQLDALEVPQLSLEASLTATLRQLELMSNWPMAGSFEYRVLDYNPGFSLVATDPSTRRGSTIIELHGFYNRTTGSRMHVEFSRAVDERWYAYWNEQYEHIWAAATARAEERHPQAP
ncbi:hypothetical protein ACR9E3_16525 [Actinomycetospora sp. C-140]